MAHTKSAIKAMRQNVKHRERNRSHRSCMRTSIKRLRMAIASGDAQTARELLPRTISIIDKSIQKGVIHRNAAARYKARLTAQVSRLVPAD